MIFQQAPIPNTIIIVLIASVAMKLLLVAGHQAVKPAHPRAQSAVLITGASRGIGKAIADDLSRLGYTVLGSVRSQSSYNAIQGEQPKQGGGKILPILLDVTNDLHIPDAVASVQTILKDNNLELVGIINNAGINPEGVAYEKAWDGGKGKVPENVLADINVASNVFDTNVIGTFRVTRSFLPLLKKENGRVILIGSYFGSISGALGLSHLYYESSKFAVEGFADGLRRSLAEEGIAVSLIKPGNIATDMNSVEDAVSPDVVSKAVVHALEAKNPRHRYYPGPVKNYPSWLMCTIFTVLPTWITDKLL
jgi:NAD(P)-dependent dehydrogenase (short-subunit alcohol dehydrogenase family)